VIFKTKTLRFNALHEHSAKRPTPMKKRGAVTGNRAFDSIQPEAA
jgi:hypothetical protein